jgi:hypothetical protein
MRIAVPGVQPLQQLASGQDRLSARCPQYDYISTGWIYSAASNEASGVYPAEIGSLLVCLPVAVPPIIRRIKRSLIRRKGDLRKQTIAGREYRPVDLWLGSERPSNVMVEMNR